MQRPGQHLAEQRPEVDARVNLAVDIAHHGQPCLEAHGFDACGKDTAADGVYHQVHALATGGFEHGGHEIAAARLDAHVEPQRLAGSDHGRSGPGNGRLLHRIDAGAMLEGRLVLDKGRAGEGAGGHGAAMGAGEQAALAQQVEVPADGHAGNGQVVGHDYEFGFVVAGDYSLGYTCLAQNDDPDVSNNPDDVEAPFFIHAAETGVTVTANGVAERNFP